MLIDPEPPGGHFDDAAPGLAGVIEQLLENGRAILLAAGPGAGLEHIPMRSTGLPRRRPRRPQDGEREDQAKCIRVAVHFRKSSNGEESLDSRQQALQLFAFRSLLFAEFFGAHGFS
jgi:hypothetical protein